MMNPQKKQELLRQVNSLTQNQRMKILRQRGIDMNDIPKVPQNSGSRRFNY